jgi:ribosomal protein S12 methylthiotransferase
LIDKSFFLDQHGCAKNQVDGELLIGALQQRGWIKTDVPEEAALIIVNSCGFIESAKTESLDAVITAHAAYPDARVLLAGCLAERYANELKDGLPEADGFFGNGDLSRVNEVVDSLFPSEKKDSQETSKPVLLPAQQGVCCGERPNLLSFPRSAYVKITEGCDNRCSFCAIPLIRGSLRSRLQSEIVEECRLLVDRGIYEINLIGQDLAAYGFGQTDSVDGNAPPVGYNSGTPSPLSSLLRAISGIPGNFIVRLLYVHPDHFPRDILPVMTADTRFLPYFDIPFQSGDESILKAMNRQGSAERYIALLSDIRSAFANAKSPYGTVAIRTTFLVGFPGETDESFETTARFSAAIHSMWSGAFTWSCEEDTKAALLKKRVPKKTAKKRLDTMQEIQIRITPEELLCFVGKTVPVLIEELIEEPSSPKDPAAAAVPTSRLALGRAWFQAPEVDGSVVLQFEDNQKDSDGKAIAPGSVVEATIMAVNGVDVEAVVQ